MSALVIGLGLVGLGLTLVYWPLAFYRMGPPIYKEEMLQSPGSRLGGRFLGFLLIQVGLLIVAPFLWSLLFPELDAKLIRKAHWNLFIFAFLGIWGIGMIGNVLYWLPWTRPYVKSKLFSPTTPEGAKRSDRRQIRLVFVLTPVVPVLALIVAILAS